MKEQLARRHFVTRSLAALGTALVMPVAGFGQSIRQAVRGRKAASPVRNVRAMGFQWETADPFLFCVHHEDAFPRGNEQMGPERSHFKGRSIGDDFIIKDGFRMYHGKVVPGFPGHPHRGFETITVVRKGIVDHSDSMGAAGRYGNGDVQWMTAGKGVQHAEMFPLVHADKPNPLELFQIWINLPAARKMVEPHFKMLWRESIPHLKHKDPSGRKTLVEIFAGRIGKLAAPAPPPNSWAADPRNEVAVWNIRMDTGARFQLPPASAGIKRHIYFYEGEKLNVEGTEIGRYHSAELQADIPLDLQAGPDGANILLLQGRPIGEPVIQYGPFVMNTKEEIQQAFQDFHNTRFGGWPWPRYDYVHPRERPRFARHADGTSEVKES